MVVVDLMHEFEQGVWKNLFTHLTRILHASDPASVIEMDRRYIIFISICSTFVDTTSDCWNTLQVPPGTQVWARWHPKVLG